MLRFVRGRHSIGLAACVLAVVFLAPAAAQAKPAPKPPKPVVSGVDFDGFASSGSAGGARVTVTGSHFRHVKSVDFGTGAGSDVSVKSTHKLLVTAPAHAIGAVHVRVTTKAGRSAATSDDVWDFQQRNLLAGGFAHSCQVLKSTRTVRCWGYNDYGQLGNGTTTDTTSPVAVSGLKHAVSIATGHYHSCALTASGNVYCWGNNEYGQLGNGTTADSSTPTKVLGLGARALDVATGTYFSCAVLIGNRAKCWGNNGAGQLGDGTTVDRATPGPVHHLSSVVDIGDGYSHACAVRKNGTEYCWGTNMYGQLGDGTTTASSVPVQVAGVNKAVLTSPGDDSTCTLTRTHTVRCWGSNQYGQLGNGSTTDSPLPVTVSGLTHASSMASGAYHVCALVHGEMTCWGGDFDGQLGNGTTTDSDTPAPVIGLGKVTTFGMGIDHTLAIASGGGTKAWGWNSSGQLGNGTTTNSSVPVPVG